MKRKWILMATSLVAALCLCFGLAACGDDKDEVPDKGPEATVTVGTSVENLVKNGLKGFSVTNNEGFSYARGVYGEQNFDFFTDEWNSNDLLVREGTWFTRWRAGEARGPIEYAATPLEGYRLPDGDVQAYGLALILSVYANNVADAVKNGVEGYSALPENGLFTGELTVNKYDLIYDIVPTFHEESGEVPDLLRSTKVLQFAAAPFTQEQLQTLLSAVVALDPADENTPTVLDTYAEIVSKGKIVAGQSAYDYLMNALAEVYRGKTSTYEDFRLGLEEQLDEFYSAIGTLIKSDPQSGFFEQIGMDTTFKFDTAGNLTGVEWNGFSAEFSDDVALEGIDEEPVFYLLPSADSSSENVVCYSGTVKDFASHPLEEVSHKEMLPFGAFEDFFKDKKLNWAGSNEYHVGISVDGEDEREVMFVTDSTDHHFAYVPDEIGHDWMYVMKEGDEYWAYGYSWNDDASTKMQIDEPDYMTDPFVYLAALMTDDAAETRYYTELTPVSGGLSFLMDGCTFTLDTEDGSISYSRGTDTVTLTIKADSIYSPPAHFPDWDHAVVASDAPLKAQWEQMMDDSLNADSVHIVRYPNTAYDLDLAKGTAKWESALYQVDGDLVMEYRQGVDGWYRETSQRTAEEVLAFPLAELETLDFADVKYERLYGWYRADANDATYFFRFEEGRIAELYIDKAGSSIGSSYTFNAYNASAVKLPTVKFTQAEWEQALADTFSASGYEVQVQLGSSNRNKLIEKFDFTNNITWASISDSSDTSLISFYRAVDGGKVYTYSDASGAWLRAESEGDASTFMQSVSELAAFKTEWERVRAQGGEPFNYDAQTETYTMSHFKVTFENDLIKTLRDTTGSLTAEFSNYGEVTLTLPALGTADNAVKNAFVQGLKASAAAENFHFEFTLDSGRGVYSVNVEQGKKSFAEASMTNGAQSVPMLQSYRETSGGTSATVWTRSNENLLPTGDPAWSNWQSSSSSTAQRDPYLYNPASIFARDDAAAELMFIFTKYDAETGTFTYRDVDTASLKIVENVFKFEGGYLTEWTTKDSSILDPLGAGASLTFTYSGYGTTTVTAPDDLPA